MEIHVNGVFIKHFHFTSRDPMAPIFFTIPTKFLTLGRYLKVDFVFKDVRRPVHYEESGDGRPLGIRIRAMYVSTSGFERKIEKVDVPQARKVEIEA